MSRRQQVDNHFFQAACWAVVLAVAVATTLLTLMTELPQLVFYVVMIAAICIPNLFILYASWAGSKKFLDQVDELVADSHKQFCLTRNEPHTGHMLTTVNRQDGAYTVARMGISDEEALLMAKSAVAHFENELATGGSPT